MPDDRPPHTPPRPCDEALLRLAEHSRDPIFRYDREGRRLYANPAAARLAGRPPADLVGATPEDAALLEAAEARRLHEAIQAVVSTGQEGRLELHLTDRDGHPQRFDTLLVPEWDAQGQVATVLCQGRNVTAPREAERHAARFVANMPGFAFTFHMPHQGPPCFPFASPGIAKIYGLRPEEVRDNMAPLHALAHPDDRPHIEAALAEAAREFAPFHIEFRVCRPGEPERWVECRALPERQPDGSLVSHGIMLDITARKAEQWRLELLERALNQTHEGLFLHDEQLRFVEVNAAACRSLGYTREELLGLTPPDIDPDTPQEVCRMLMRDRMGRPFTIETRHRTKDGRPFPVEVSGVSFRHDGARYGLSMVRDIRERRELLARLEQSERDFRSLAESSPDYIIRYDREGRIRYLNRRLAAALSITEIEAVLGRHPNEVWPDGRFSAIIQAAARAVASGEAQELEMQKPGTEGPRIQQVVLVPERDVNGAIIGSIAFGRDITAIRATERQLRHFIDTLPGMAFAFRLGPGGRMSFPFASPAILDLYGVPPEAVREDMTPLHALVHPDDRPRIDAALADSAHTLGPLRVEFRIRRPGMPERWVECRSLPDLMPDGATLWHGIMLDITERRQAQGRMELLERAINQSSEGFFLTDETARFVDVNEAACRSLGLAREALLGLTPLDIDPEISAEALQAMLHGDASAPHTFETRHRTQDGRYFPVEITAVAFHHEGRRYGLAMVRDISERQGMLARLAQSEREFRSLAANLPDNVARWDAEGRFLYINPTQERLLGLTHSAVVGRRPDQLFPCPETEATVATIRRVAQRGAPELLARVPLFDAAGELRIHDIKLAPEFDTEGAVIGVLGLGRDMTDLYRLQEAVAAREEEFRSLAENSPDNILRYDRGCRQVYANPPVVAVMQMLLGRNPVGETPNEAYPDGSFRDYDAALRRVIACGRMEDFEIQLPDRGAGVQHHQIRMAAERNAEGEVVGVVAIGRDITATREAERRLKHFIDHLPGLAYVLRRTSDGRAGLAFASPALTGLFGLAPEAVSDDIAPLQALAHPDDRPRIEAALADSARTLDPFRLEYRVCRPGLAERWLDVRATPLRDADGATLWYGLMLDITERKQAETAARDHLEEAARLQRLETANELATLLAHEINQPLAAIASYAEACRQQLQQPNPNRDRLDANLGRIGQQAIRAGDTIRHLRSFIRRGRIDPSPMSLGAVLRRACDLQAAHARAAGIRLEIAADPALPPVLGVEVQVEQVLLNLLRNAQDAILEAGRADGGIRIQARRVQGEVQVTVEDDGPGLDPQRAARLFEPFVTTKAQGLGVGLRISRGLVEAHGGRLWVEPQTPGGRFHFTLPVAPEGSDGP